MLLEALAIGQMQWLEVDQQTMLICPAKQLVQCVEALPVSIQSSLPALPRLKASLSHRQGYSLTFAHSQVQGMVVYQPQPQPLIAQVGYQIIEFDSEYETSNFLMHEIGHVMVKAGINGAQLAPLFSWQQDNFDFHHYQAELLADLYAMWQMAKLDDYPQRLAALVDKRNLMLINDTQNRDYWSVPIISEVSEHFSAERLKSIGFADFVDQVWQLELQVKQPLWFGQMLSLFNSEFSLQPNYHSTHYMRWHRQGFGGYLQPTLQRQIGEVAANSWLRKRALL